MKKEHILFVVAAIVFCVVFFGWKFERYGSNQAVSDWEYVKWVLLTSPYGVEEKIHDILERTRYTLYWRHYQITYKETITLLKNRAILGTDVKLLLEDATYGNNYQAWNGFKKAIAQTPVQIKNDDDLDTNFIHAKSFVTDDAFIVSTANLWYPWYHKNREYWFISQDPEVVSSMKFVFERDWNWEFIRSRWLPKWVVMCPVNCRDSLNTLLESAQESIKIQAQYVSDRETVELLKEKQRDGVIVQIISSDRQRKDNLSWLSGVRIQQSPYVHSKNILVDWKLLLVGSMNLSQNAIENNREMSIITDDINAIRRFNGQFLSDLENTVPLEQDWRERW